MPPEKEINGSLKWQNYCAKEKKKIHNHNGKKYLCML